MKKFTCCLTATVCVVGMLAVAVNADPPTKSLKQIRNSAETQHGNPSGVLQVGPLIENTGFEAVDGWVPRDGLNNGFVCGPAFAACAAPVDGACPDPGGNCCINDPNPDNGWYVSTTSMHCKEPHIDTVHPATGEQHLRFQRAAGNADGHYGPDPGCVGFGGPCRVSAFSPLATTGGVEDVGLVVGRTTTDVDIYGSATFNAHFVMFEVAEGYGPTSVASYIYFANWGYLYALEYFDGGYGFPSMGYWQAGDYKHLQVRHDPCADVITYNYDGVDLYSHPMTFMAPWVNRVILQTDNGGEVWDVDNLNIAREDACPTTCGADGVEAGEQCDFGEGEDANCPGRCVEPGGTGPNGEEECQCIEVGGSACDAVDLLNGPSTHVSVGGWFTFVADTPAMALDMCDTLGFDSALEVWTSTDPGNEDCALIGDELTSVQLASNDDCDVTPGNPYGTDADEFAPCQPVGSPWQSCTCVPTTIGQRYWVLESRGGNFGTTRNIAANKRLDCGGAWEGGACCDGVSGTCTDDVLAGDCAGEFDTFTLNKLCDGLTCDPVPGACCDRSPGAAGACANDVINADCQGMWDVWTGNARCEGVTCEEITGACCDPLDGFCSVTLQGDCTAAHPGGPIWTPNVNCGAVTCDPALGACCNTRFGTCTDDVTLADCSGENFSWTKGDVCSAETCPDPFIPTVSQWGLVIMTLLLLIGAKVYFGRREALA